MGWGTVYVKIQQESKDVLEKTERAETRQPWILRIYWVCLAGDLLFAAYTATTLNLSRANLFPRCLSVHLSFSQAVLKHFSLSHLSRSVFLSQASNGCASQRLHFKEIAAAIFLSNPFVLHPSDTDRHCIIARLVCRLSAGQFGAKEAKETPASVSAGAATGAAQFAPCSVSLCEF